MGVGVGGPQHTAGVLDREGADSAVQPVRRLRLERNDFGWCEQSVVGRYGGSAEQWI